MPVLFSPSVAILLNFKTQIWSNMLEFVFLKYISKEIESWVRHTVNPDLNATLICTLELDLWNLALYTSWSFEEDMKGFDQPMFWRQVSFTPSTPFTPLSPFFSDLMDQPLHSPLPSSLHTGLLPFPPLLLLLLLNPPSLFSSSPLPLQLLLAELPLTQTPAALTKWTPRWEQPPLLAWVGDEKNCGREKEKQDDREKKKGPEVGY